MDPMTNTRIHPVYWVSRCATCGQTIESRVEKANGSGTYICAAGHVHTVTNTDEGQI